MVVGDYVLDNAGRLGIQTVNPDQQADNQEQGPALQVNKKDQDHQRANNHNQERDPQADNPDLQANNEEKNRDPLANNQQ